MPPTLRKRPAPAATAAPPTKKAATTKKAAAPAKRAETKKETAAPKKEAAPAPKKDAAAKPGAPAVGATIDLEGFGGEVETHDGSTTTLAQLVAASGAGVVLFTYPAASTPGCTKQACFFRDDHALLTSSGLAIYGLSKDSPAKNTTFKTKYELPYPLLCDPTLSLIKAIGLKNGADKTTRGVFVVDKSGKVLAAEAGSPDGTVKVVKKIVEGMGKEEK